MYICYACNTRLHTTHARTRVLTLRAGVALYGLLCGLLAPYGLLFGLLALYGLLLRASSSIRPTLRATLRAGVALYRLLYATRTHELAEKLANMIG